MNRSRTLFLFALLAISLSACSLHTSEAMAKNLVFIGDSLTQWFDWQSRFADYNIVNLGVAGEPVEGLLNRRELIHEQIRSQPDYIFLMTGINNLLREQYGLEAPYREIVRSLRTRYKQSTVVVQSLLPVEQPVLNNSVIRDVNRRLEQIADEYDAEYLDIYALFLDRQGKPKSEYFLDDGIHLTDKGYQVWVKEVERFVKKRRYQHLPAHKRK